MEKNEELIILIAVLAVSNFYFWYKLSQEKSKRDKLKRENSRLIADNAKMEADDLKFRLQPHTINNILANLKVLSNKLNRGMDALSIMLEYILYHGKQDLVSVEEEMHYLRNYLNLNDLFISQIDSIKVDDSGLNQQVSTFKSKCIPHLITGYFLENAFKHGDIHHPQFLAVKLLLDEEKFEMIVTNKIKSAVASKKGGIGLNNMNKRLDLLVPGKHKIASRIEEDQYEAYLKISF